MLPRTAHSQKAPVPLAPCFRKRYDASPGKVRAGKRVGICRNLGGSTCRYHFSAVDSRARTDIDDIIRLAHHVLVMLHYNNRVSEVAQLLERGNKQIVVTLVKSDARLIKHVKHADKRRAYLGCKTYTLSLASRKRSGAPGERKISKSDAGKEAEP